MVKNEKFIIISVRQGMQGAKGVGVNGPGFNVYQHISDSNQRAYPQQRFPAIPSWLQQLGQRHVRPVRKPG